MPKINVGQEIEIFVQDWGEGKPVFLVHGWPLNHQMFEYQVPTLVSNGFRVVALDLRGFGLSGKPWHGCDYDTWANDIGYVIRALGLHDVALCGFSMGGAIALHYMAKTGAPQITKLALFAAPLPSMIKKADNPNGVSIEQWNQFIDAESDDRARFKKEFAASFFNKPVSAELLRWFEALGMQVDAHASLRGLEEMRDRDLRAELSSITVPTKIFHGINDKVVPFALGEEQNRLIADSELVRFEQSGHDLFYGERAKFTTELLRFLREGARAKQVIEPIPT